MKTMKELGWFDPITPDQSKLELECNECGARIDPRTQHGGTRWELRCERCDGASFRTGPFDDNARTEN